MRHLRRSPLFALLVSLLAVGCRAADSADDAAPAPTDAAGRVERWLSEMTLEEKVEQMHGARLDAETRTYVTAGNERLGIPRWAMMDGPRGVRIGEATTFPVGMARAATWSPELERRVGEAIGEELAAKGGNVILAPTVNNLRHPRWGRAQETYGEDVALLAAMGGAFVEGAQEHVVASLKHFAANSIEDTRNSVDVQIDERTLREIYLRQFEAIVRRARPGSVMSAYNSVNGQWCSENAHLLRDVLRGDWGFEGFVVSDWVLAVRSTVPSALAGLDVEMPVGMFYANEKLVAAVADGELPEATIDESVRRNLRTMLEARLDAPERPSPDVVETQAHTDLALDVEREAIVLLKNEAAALPLDASQLHAVAVVGELADAWNLGDHGSSDALPSWAVTPLAGLRDRLGADVEVTHVAGPISPADEDAIRAADCAIVVVGTTAADEGENTGTSGEGSDRETLELSPAHQALIAESAALNPRTIVVLEGGTAIGVASWIASVPAALMAWYPGQEGGHAIADVLLGDVSPSGKLPVTFAASEAQLPPFPNDEPKPTYDYFHGYRLLDRDGADPSFPFGHGLSYTSFGYSNLRLAEEHLAAGGTQRASVDVRNTGDRAGKAVVELYVGYEGSSVTRAVRDLKGFAKVELAPGETRTVTIDVPASDLAYWDVARGGWTLEPIRYVVQVGGSSRDTPLSASFDVVP